MRYLIKVLAVCAMCALGTAGCSSVAGTGRNRLMLMGASEETKLGEDAYKQILSKEKIATSHPANAIVQRVGQRLAEAAGRPEYKWEVKLVQKDEVNAWALPGGKTAIYTGILPLCTTEAGLAVVMGHEFGHVIARHGAERMSQQMVVQAGAVALQYALGEQSAEKQQLLMAAYGVGTSVGVMLPYSRKHEFEADQLGQTLMAKAGYDPAEAARFWKRMLDLKKGGGHSFAFLSTHPPDDQRIRRLEQQTGHARSLYESAPQKYGVGASIPTR